MIIKTYGQKANEIKPIIEKHINKIYDNIKNFATIELFNNLTIEICDPSSPDCPQDIKKYAGLTFQDKKLIQLNANVTEFHDNPDKYYSNLISHEFGHYWAYSVGFDNLNGIRNVWQQIRGHKEGPIIIPTELVAEDFRILFGSDQARGFERGTYTQATRVQGLRDLYTIWKKATNKIKTLEWWRYVSNVTYKNFSGDFDYIELHIESRSIFFYFDVRTEILTRDKF